MTCVLGKSGNQEMTSCSFDCLIKFGNICKKRTLLGRAR